MDIQNLSSRFVASMNIDFYLGKIKYIQANRNRILVPLSSWVYTTS